MIKVIFFFVLTILFVVSLYFFSIKREIPKTESKTINKIEINIDEYVIKAEGYLVYDIDKDLLLLEKNSSITYPTASISKLLSALVAYQYINDEDVVTIGKKDLTVYANTTLKTGDSWYVKELLKFSLIESSNIGITAIERYVEEKTGSDFFDLVGEYQKNKKLNQSYFINSTGLDIHSGLSSAKSSAKDIVSLLRLSIDELPDIIYDTGIYSKNFYTIDGKEYKATNTNKLTKKFNNIFVSKTGFTNLAGGNLAILINIGNSKIAIVVMSSTAKERFNDAEKLVNIVKKYKNVNNI